MEKPIALEGICFSWSEQGIGPHWSFQELKHILPPTTEWPHERWNYDGLWKLENGDHLTIFDKKTSKKVRWSGFISLWTDKIGRVHQRDISRKKWVRWFHKKYPAEFTPGPNQRKKSS